MTTLDTEQSESAPAPAAPQAAAEVPATEAPVAEAPAAPAEAPAVEVHEASLNDVSPKSIKAPAGQIDILLDTAVPVMASLGSAEVLIRDVLQLGPGSVLKLERQTGEPVDLYLRGVRFATGHIVVVGDQLGVRIKEILTGAAEQEAEA